MKKILLLITVWIIDMQANAQSKTSTDETKAKTNENVASLTKTKELKDGWAVSGTFNLNFSEGGLNQPWRDVKGGEEQTIGVKALVDCDFDFQDGTRKFMNNLRARYGMSRIASSGQGFLKSDDFLAYTFIYASEIKKNLSLSALFSVTTQFDYYFLSPGEIKLGPGLMYKPNKNFSAMFSPAMANLTTKFATEHRDLDLFSVDSGKTTRIGVGAFLQMKASYDIAKGVSYKGFATLFSDYTNKPDIIIMDWTNLFTLTVNKYLGATVSINLRYNDWEIGQFQIQHGLGVGLSYKL